MRISLRLVFSLIMVELVVLGGVLAFLPRIAVTNQTMTVQNNLCAYPVNLSFLSNQAVEYTCRVVPNAWSDVSLTTKKPATFAVIIIGQDNVSSVISNSTGSTFRLNIPFFLNGTMVIQIRNGGSLSNPATGSVSVYTLTPRETTLATREFPNRNLGLAVITVSALAFILLIWDPSGYASRALGRLSSFGSSTPKKRQESDLPSWLGCPA